MKIIITEQQNEKVNRKIRLAVGKLGLVQSLNMFGKDILKQAFINEPYLILSEYNKLKPIEKGDKIFYVDNDNLPLFYYYKEEQVSKKGYYYIHSNIIWSFFEVVMDYDYTEIHQIIKEWLGTTYNLRGLTPVASLQKEFDGPII